MCVYSNVLDHFAPKFPWPESDLPLSPRVIPRTPDPSVVGDPTVSTLTLPWQPQVDLNELRQLIQDFKTAMEAAKTVDRIVGHADCESLEKLKLVERVKDLEALVAKYEAKASKTKKAAKPKLKIGAKKLADKSARIKKKSKK